MDLDKLREIQAEISYTDIRYLDREALKEYFTPGMEIVIEGTGRARDKSRVVIVEDVAWDRIRVTNYETDKTFFVRLGQVLDAR